MATFRLFTRAIASGAIVLALAACSSTASSAPGTSTGTGSPGGGATAGPTSPGAPAASLATTGGGGGQGVDICQAIGASEVGAILGKSVTANGPVAGEAQSCSWYSDDLTNAYLYRTDAAECDDTRSSLTGSATVPGADFAGPNATLGATFAGKASGGACFVVEVSPTERAPQADVLGQLLQLLIQKAGG